MTEAEFAAIKERWANADDPAMALIDVARGDILALIRAIEERDAYLHDLTLDGSALSRRAVEEFAAGLWDWVNIERQRHQMTTDFDTGAACALGVVQARIDELRASGTAPDPLPPDQVRQENERLRERLREIRCRVEDYLDTMRNCGGKWSGVEAALKRLREMTSEGRGE